MKKLLVIVLLVSFCGFAQTTTDKAANQPAAQKPPFELETFYMAILRRQTPYDARKVQMLAARQRAYWQAIADKNDLVLAGPVNVVKDELAAVMIYMAPSADEALKVSQADPVVRAHLWSAEVHPWMTMKGVLKPQHTLDTDSTYYLGFLVRGPKFSPEDSPERQKIQEGHMANMKRLADLGKLVAAGPFGDDGNLRGIFVFRVASMEEALELTNTDPAVQSGRLAIDLYEWKLPNEAFAK